MFLCLKNFIQQSLFRLSKVATKKKDQLLPLKEDKQKKNVYLSYHNWIIKDSDFLVLEKANVGIYIQAIANEWGRVIDDKKDEKKNRRG